MLNLLPIGQLDGGHVTYALSRRVHRLVSRLTIAGMLLLVGWSALRAMSRGTALPSLMLWTVVLVLLGSRHPPVRDETSPLGPGRRALALVGLLIFVLCFMANPLQVAG